MSSPILPETCAGRIGPGARTQARLAVLIAHGLSRLPPGLLERAMRTALAGGGRRPTTDLVERYRAGVVAVSAVCAGEGCLPRSVATALVARVNGYAVSWCTGVKDAPFTAHAWVEVDGRAIGEPAEIETFVRVLHAGPSSRRPGRPRPGATWRSDGRG